MATSKKVTAKTKVKSKSKEASNAKLKVPESGWDSDFWAVQDWYRDA